MTIQDLTTGVGQWLGPLGLMLVLFKFTAWPLWLVVVVGLPCGIVLGVAGGVLLARLLERDSP